MQTEQVLFSLPLERLEPIIKKWFNDVLTNQAQVATPPQAATIEPVRLYGDRQAAKYLNCSVMTIQSLRRSGAIPFIRTGRKLIYISNELDESLKVQARKFSRKPTQE